MARRYRQHYPNRRIVAFDNLSRRGSELNLADFRARNIEFIHGDVRFPRDLESLTGTFDLLIDAAAEPSVHAATNAIDTNLKGTLNCLEWARRRAGALLFLSTSRPQPKDPQPAGLSAAGIGESFATSGHRSLYGATKLASELFVQEYCAAYGLNTLINRCGVIAGPGQWGRADQGVYALWVAGHYFGLGLRYTGFGGRGKQVRDLLHPDDLFALLEAQVACPAAWTGDVFNAGGGLASSTSLVEYTRLCQEATGRTLAIGSIPETQPTDIPYYVTDNAKAQAAFGWTPQKTARDIVGDIHTWLVDNGDLVRPMFTDLTVSE
ncbi:CDP-paratose 2-epimerase [Geodia barretti]|uniref:CDP-paratose 2-epimerase n=1 Tax=Geodia barretti TaxID=519541 RepID=A0AA35TDI6_GEOBA|nr:CDP-paratose 2-epimerase [Geodia barretti]